MPPIRPDQPLVPSILDRLIDDDPGVSFEAPQSRAQLMRDLKQSVRRDLEALLNTRQRNLVVPPGLAELGTSLVNYGIPDFSGLGPVVAKDRDTFCRSLEGIVRRYEPRLRRVAVELVTGADTGDRTLRFRIDALLQADPAPEPVVFDTQIEPGTGAVTVAGGDS